MTDENDLMQGTRYRVQFQDCCIEGEFTAVLAELVGDEFGPDKLTFDNGVVLTQIYGVAFEEVAADGGAGTEPVAVQHG